jgi:hypothetical protein
LSQRLIAEKVCARSGERISVILNEEVTARLETKALCS